MRIAIVSDIHGNLMALDAVMTDLERQAPDQVWCGGDIAFGGPWPNECIERVRTGGWTTVKGNTDVWVTGDPQTIDDPDRRADLQALAGAHGISDDDADWLMHLPVGHSGPGSTLLVHGTPESPFTAPTPDDPADRFACYAGKAQIVIYGHVHVAFVRRLTDGTIVCNPGSVGMPKDGDRASYLLIDLEGPEFVLRHRRVLFDRRAAIAQAKVLGSPLGDFFVRNFDGD